MPFIAFSYLISLGRTSSAMLKKSDETGHLCLAPDLRGKSFSFLLLSMMLAVCFSYMAFIMLVYFPFMHILLCLIINECYIL